MTLWDDARNDTDLHHYRFNANALFAMLVVKFNPNKIKDDQRISAQIILGAGFFGKNLGKEHYDL